jgi:hypothetical protein
MSAEATSGRNPAMQVNYFNVPDGTLGLCGLEGTVHARCASNKAGYLDVVWIAFQFSAIMFVFSFEICIIIGGYDADMSPKLYKAERQSYDV